MDPERIVALLLAWFEASARDLPWRRTRDPYAIWVSEIMLQQTQVKTVVAYWERWMRELPTILSLAKAKPQTVHKLWEGLGYYTRARNLQKAASIIVAHHGAQFPEKFDQVLELPGIGRYTAGAICSIAFNQARPILDGNVMRVLTRLYGIEGDPRDSTVNARLWNLAEALVQEASARLNTGRARSSSPRPARWACSELNQSLMELGALVCTPRLAKCDVCPLSSECQARAQRRVELLPQIKPRPAVTHRRFIAFVVSKDGKVLVRQRPPGVVNAHLWEFPNIEVSVQNGDPLVACREALGMSVDRLTPLAVIRHSITRYRIRLDVFEVAARPGLARRGAGRWLSARRVNQLPFASAHKQILNKLMLPA